MGSDTEHQLQPASGPILPDALAVRKHLQTLLAQGERYAHQVALLLIDFDSLEAINDSFGQQAGKRLLDQISDRLSEKCRQTDTFARLGNEVFALIMPQISEPDEAMAAARKFLELLARPFGVDDQEVVCSACIGIAIYPADGNDAESLLHAAGIAVQQAREIGPGRIHYYDECINTRADERQQMAAELRHAVTRNEFEVYYQPKIACSSGEVVGFEALLRWNHPQNGLVGPTDFVPLLEESGLIVEVGRWVLLESCRQTAAWIAAGLGRPSVAVNLSARQFETGTLIQTIEDVLAETELPPDRLELELTEGILMRNVEQIADILARLRRLGVKISIDDFGTGYSSLAYLKRFPLDTLKVDRSFVQDITADPDDVSITRAIITLAHNLKLKVVAEGVETEGQFLLLLANHCDEVQGYLFSKPIPALAMQAMLADGKRRLPDSRTLGMRPPTILLVDDEENILAAMRRLLRRDGYRILTANSGQEGLELLAQNEVDVILSDQRMPGMTGVEFLRRVKTIHPDTVRMVLSGYTELQSITSAINEGAIYKFLTKPWDDDLIRADIQEAFRHKQLADENRNLAGALSIANESLASANEQLHTLLEQSQNQVTHDESTLRILHEILQHVPAPIIGIDESGTVAMANSEAERVFGQGSVLIGCDATSCLPASINLFLLNGESEFKEPGGMWVRRYQMGLGPSSTAKGILLVFDSVGER